MQIVDKFHVVKGLDPVADAFAGTVTSDVVKVEGEAMLWVIYKGVGATGTSVVTALAAPDVTPSSTAAIPFQYRIQTSGDTWGDWTAATTAGFTTTAGSSQQYQIMVDAAELAEEGFAYCQLNMVESVNDPVVGAVIGMVLNQRYGEQPQSLIV